MTIIYEDLDLPIAGGTPYPAEVRIRLAGAQGRPVLGKKISQAGTVAGEVLLSTANGGISSTGYWEADLWPNSDLSPGGTTYLVTRKVGCDAFATFISVPVTGGPYEASTREDDPLGEITPSALAAHAGDLALHGGGIQIDYKEVVTTVVVTGSGGGIFSAPVLGTTIVVPDLARPLRLHGHVPALQQPGGPTEESWGIFPLGTYGFFAELDSVSPSGLNTTIVRHGELWARLPAHSAGQYVIAGTGQSGNLTAVFAGSVLQKGFLEAITA